MNDLAELLKCEENISMSQTGFVLGIVTDNENKDFAGQVNVEFTAHKSGRNICCWMPVLQSLAGKEYGAYIIPEVGDKVLVGFLSGRENPFVMGCLFPGENTFTKDSFAEKNAVKCMKLKSGIAVTLNELDNKQSVHITTPKGINLKLEDENETAILCGKDNDTLLKIDLKNGNVEVKGKNEILLKSGSSQIKLDGQGGTIEIKCDRLDIKASQQIKVAGDQMVSISGNMLQAEGKQTLQLKGGSMTEVSGGIVKIN